MNVTDKDGPYHKHRSRIIKVKLTHLGYGVIWYSLERIGTSWASKDGRTAAILFMLNPAWRWRHSCCQLFILGCWPGFCNASIFDVQAYLRISSSMFLDLIQIYFRCNYLSTFSKIQSHPWKSNPKMSSLNQWPLCVPGFGWDLFITRTEIPSPRWPAKCGAKFGITSLLLACNLG